MGKDNTGSLGGGVVVNSGTSPRNVFMKGL